MSRRAKTLTNEELNQVLEYVGKTSKAPLRDYAMILLSFKGGLRVAEIAGLTWRDVTDAFGNIRKDAFSVPDNIAKKGHGRTVPMHVVLYTALVALKQHSGGKSTDPIVPSLADGAAISPNTLQRYMGRLYANMGLDGVSSHSGRRSFITRGLRIANQHGCSIRDVQQAVGHRYLDTTEAYIDPSQRVGELVNAI